MTGVFCCNAHTRNFGKRTGDEMGTVECVSDTLDAESAAKTVAPSLLPHFAIALNSLHKPMAMPRTLCDLRSHFGGALYDESVKLAELKISESNHVGQRKLCIALIEFLTEVHAFQVRTVGHTSPVLVLYVGSSLVAALAANDLFPDDRIVCYDPIVEMTLDVARRELGAGAPKIISSRITTTTKALSAATASSELSKKPILLFTGQAAGTFRDDTCKYVLELARHCGSMEIALVSDIRRPILGAEKEIGIAEDMVNQARWAALLQVRFYCFKFRLPFKVTEDIRSEYAKMAPLSTVGCDSSKCVPYLGGQCVLQKYARDPSTEMRLTGLTKPTMVMYDVSEVEALLAPFNAVHRSRTSFVPYASAIGGNDQITPADVLNAARCAGAGTLLPGRGASFDALGECCVIRDALLIGKPHAGLTEFEAACAHFSSMFAARGLYRQRIGVNKSAKLQKLRIRLPNAKPSRSGKR